MLRLAAEAGLNEKAFAEGLRSPDTTGLASNLAAACRCKTLLVQLFVHIPPLPKGRMSLTRSLSLRCHLCSPMLTVSLATVT